ncbi:hypothetical protein HAALTHF_14580n [Vreelandella aquamarina]|nr:hypothetical protein HAALTHF_14580n [Halomonas axialensis]
MVQRCNAAGVDVYADAVINHVAHGKGLGIAGSSYDSEALSYPHYQRDDFHEPCGIEQSDYAQNAESVRQCQLVGLPDLNTSDPTVQSRIADYLDTLAALGVGGIRIDAAKHMAPSDIAEILAQVDAPLYAFQEVIDLGAKRSVPRSIKARGISPSFATARLLVIFSTIKPLPTFSSLANRLPCCRANKPSYLPTTTITSVATVRAAAIF